MGAGPAWILAPVEYKPRKLLHHWDWRLAEYRAQRCWSEPVCRAGRLPTRETGDVGEIRYENFKSLKRQGYIGQIWESCKWDCRILHVDCASMFNKLTYIFMHGKPTYTHTQGLLNAALLPLPNLLQYKASTVHSHDMCYHQGDKFNHSHLHAQTLVYPSTFCRLSLAFCTVTGNFLSATELDTFPMDFFIDQTGSIWMLEQKRRHNQNTTKE